MLLRRDRKTWKNERAKEQGQSRSKLHWGQESGIRNQELQEFRSCRSCRSSGDIENKYASNRQLDEPKSSLVGSEPPFSYQK
jgi:hypothetical protein